MNVVFTGLDGAPLDHHTYGWSPARPALNELRRLAVPVILCTSKTRAETGFWRTELELPYPFIVENGGAILIPQGCFPDPALQPPPSNRYHAITLGTPYEVLVDRLQTASRLSGCRVRGFSGMKVAEVATACGLPLQQALLASQREYDEPFILKTAVGRTKPSIRPQLAMSWKRSVLSPIG